MVTGMPFNSIWAARNLQALHNTLAFHKLIPIITQGAPTNGVTGAGTADKGTNLTDVTNGILYINTGTLASPVWTKVGTQV
jgi:hypothetical protein